MSSQGPVFIADTLGFLIPEPVQDSGTGRGELLMTGIGAIHWS